MNVPAASPEILVCELAAALAQSHDRGCDGNCWCVFYDSAWEGWGGAGG